MLKCPICGFDNEDGVLFCEQCKSDLSTVAPPAPEPPIPLDVGPGDSGPTLPDVQLPMAAVIDEPPIPLMEAAVIAPSAEHSEPTDVLPGGLAEQAAVGPVAPGAAAALDAPVIAPVPDAGPPVAHAPGSPNGIPAGAQPKLIVIRGLKVGAEYPIYPELNYIGRFDEKAVDIDLEDQEAPDRTWSSRQHAVIYFDDKEGVLTIEDLNSLNHTYVNRLRVDPGIKKPLAIGDIIQIGTVHFKVKV